jgi:drug/metabolite transporter (DMT)-like permease
MEAVLVPFIVFATIFGIIYIVVTARNKERMALIERGADPALFEAVKKNRSHGLLKWGLFLLGIGLGVIIANIMVTNGIMNEEAAYPSMIFVFGGLALISAHFMLRKTQKEENLGI